MLILKKREFFQATAGLLLIATGVYMYRSWNRLLDESGGPDAGNEFIFAIPNFAAIIIGIVGIALLIHGLKPLWSYKENRIDDRRNKQ